MSWLEFISNIIASLIWPITVIGIIIFFKDKIIYLISNLDSAKYGDLELLFGKELTRLEETAVVENGISNEKILSEKSPDEVDLNFMNRIEELATISPRAAVSEAWREIEIMLYELSPEKKRSIREKIVELSNTEAISDRLAGVLMELFSLRNKAIHSNEGEISLPKALDYANFTYRILDQLREKLNSNKLAT